MVSKLSSSQNVDLIDVGAVMEAFETINKVHINLLGRVESVAGARQLVMIVSALVDAEDTPDPKYLASVNVNLGSGQHRTIEGAIMWALYQLDWKLGQREIEETDNNA